MRLKPPNALDHAKIDLDLRVIERVGGWGRPSVFMSCGLVGKSGRKTTLPLLLIRLLFTQVLEEGSGSFLLSVSVNVTVLFLLCVLPCYVVQGKVHDSNNHDSNNPLLALSEPYPAKTAWPVEQKVIRPNHCESCRRCSSG